MLLQCVGLASPNSPDKPPTPHITTDNTSTSSQLKISATLCETFNSPLCDANSTASSLSTTSSTSGIDSACSSLEGFSSLESNTEEENISFTKPASNIPQSEQLLLQESNLKCTEQNRPSESQDTGSRPSALQHLSSGGSPPSSRPVNQGPWLVRPRSHRASTFSGFLPSRSSCPRIDENSNPEYVFHIYILPFTYFCLVMY